MSETSVPTPSAIPAASVPGSEPPGAAAPTLEVLGAASNPGSGGDLTLAFFDPAALPLALLFVVGAAVAVRMINRVARGLADRITVHRLAIKQGATMLGFAVYAVGIVSAAIAVFEFSTQAILAVSGVLAVAGGFLLKDVAESGVASLFLLTRPFSVGDRVHFGGYYGEVVEIGLRTVQLVTLDDNLVTIPSNRFLQETVASANAGQLDCMVVMSFYATADSDDRRAREIVRDAVLSSRFCYLGKPIAVLTEMKLADQLGCVIEITAKAYVFDARHEKAFASDVTERVLVAWRNAGVALPGSAAARAA